ncbi:MAG: hypothetical protein NC342_03275 [Pseudoflavonifractor sp.]|nr:hypothetical protein [Alloprevotella sp.]MCM1116536.1 hypothetical protein [Pseudoflavonifractor sp.]
MKTLIYLTVVLTIIIITTTSAIKVKYTEKIDPYYFKIEGVETGNGVTTFKLKVWQEGMRTVKIVLDETPYLFLDGYEEGIPGDVVKWGKQQNISSAPKVVGEKPVKFEVIFPDTIILFSSKFDLKLGYVVGRDTSELILRDVPVKQKNTMF